MKMHLKFSEVQFLEVETSVFDFFFCCDLTVSMLWIFWFGFRHMLSALKVWLY